MKGVRSQWYRNREQIHKLLKQHSVISPVCPDSSWCQGSAANSGFIRHLGLTTKIAGSGSDHMDIELMSAKAVHVSQRHQGDDLLAAKHKIRVLKLINVFYPQLPLSSHHQALWGLPITLCYNSFYRYTYMPAGGICFTFSAGLRINLFN